MDKIVKEPFNPDDQEQLKKDDEVIKEVIEEQRKKKITQEIDISNGIKKANPITEGTTPTCKPPMAFQGLDVKKLEMLLSNGWMRILGTAG